jgi:hypothetical protein
MGTTKRRVARTSLNRSAGLTGDLLRIGEVAAADARAASVRPSVTS